MTLAKDIAESQQKRGRRHEGIARQDLRISAAAEAGGLGTVLENAREDGSALGERLRRFGEPCGIRFKL
jgi:hypothetical protein